MDRKKTKQVILKIMKKQESCFKDLIVKINEQRKKIKEKDEALVLEIIEEKNILIEIYKNLEEEMESHLQLLSQLEIQDLLVEGVALKTNLEELLKKIIHMEEECEEEISLKMKEVEKRIFGLQKGKKIGKGYGEFFKNRPLISRKV